MNTVIKRLDSSGDTEIPIKSLKEAQAAIDQAKAEGKTIFTTDPATGESHRVDEPTQLGVENIEVPRIVGG